MPSRKVPFANGEFYHIFNRGVAKMPIFYNSFHYKHFLKTMLYYQIEGPKPRLSLYNPTITSLASSKKIVEIICYCLMPNHFHFLLKQNIDGGITEFISKLSNSYTKYLNIKEERVGPLFQGEFKSVHVETDEQLLHLSRYIHLNPLVGYKTNDLELYLWSSYIEYVNSKNNICIKDIILGQFKSPSDYKQYVLDQEDYARKLEQIKHLILDFED